VKGGATLEWQSPRLGVRVFGERDFRDAGDIRERSGAVNSLAAQEFASDYTDPYGVQAVGIGLDARGVLGLRWHADASLERQRALEIRAVPAQGDFPRILPAMPLRAFRLAFAADRPTTLSFLGTELKASGKARVTRFTTDDAAFTIEPGTVVRAFASVDVERPFGRSRLVLTTRAGAVGGSGALPPQELLYFGGPLSAPGYEFHELAARGGASQRVEWRTPVPFPSVNLGRFGRVPGQATLAPFAQATAIRRAYDLDVDHPSGVYPSVGVALQPFYDLLRLQVGRGLRNGRWEFNVDVSRDFWGIL
jgi:hypothetical protein